MKTTATLALVALLGSAAAASAATNQIFAERYQERAASVDIDLVRSNSGGTLEIFSFVNGAPGKLLGSENVVVGVERDVTVQLKSPGTSNVIAVFTPEDGSAPISERIILNR